MEIEIKNPGNVNLSPVSVKNTKEAANIKVMEILNKPELTHLALGSTLKILQVTGTTGMKMPWHHSTQESIIVVQKGEALLQIPGDDHLLKAGDTFIIPAKKEHALTIKKDLKALAVMGIKSEINFI